MAVGLQLTRFGHRRRPALCGVAAGTALFALIDSVRVYAFAHANPSGIYRSGIANTDGAIPRAALGLLVLLLAVSGLRRSPRRPKPRPGPYPLVALLLTASGVVVAAVAVATGPAVQLSRFGQLPYSVPFAFALVAALLLGATALTRRPPVLAAAVTFTGCALLASLFAPATLRYPLAIFADLLLLAAAGALVLATRRPSIDAPPPAGPPLVLAPPPVPRPLARFRR